MSAATLSGAALTAVHHQFVAALPALLNTIRYEFRHLPRQRRSEAIADGLAACWHSWYGLARRGRDPLAVGPSGIARNAARYVKNGRRLGCGTIGRGAMDLFNPKAQTNSGLRIVRLAPDRDATADRKFSTWRDWACEDNRCSPGDEACFRIDYEAWLASLSPRKRTMAELLAQGHRTGEAAELLGVTPAAVSISRTWLDRSWQRFQGEPLGGTSAPARRPRGRPRRQGSVLGNRSPRRYVPRAAGGTR